MARRWVKVWVQESLTGTIRFDFTPDERSVWYDLIILAGNCRLEGVIAAGPSQPYPHNWIAGTLNIPLELLEATLEKCKLTKRIHENSFGIRLLNWRKYQSEYERQKPYREAKQQGKNYKKYKYRVCRNCGHKSEDRTEELECPKCGGDFDTDYTRGRYGHMVKQ